MYSKMFIPNVRSEISYAVAWTRSGTFEVSAPRQQARDGARAMGVAVSNAIKWTPRMEKHATQALAGIAAQRRKEKRRDRADMKKEGPAHSSRRLRDQRGPAQTCAPCAAGAAFATVERIA